LFTCLNVFFCFFVSFKLIVTISFILRFSCFFLFVINIPAMLQHSAIKALWLLRSTSSLCFVKDFPYHLTNHVCDMFPCTNIANDAARLLSVYMDFVMMCRLLNRQNLSASGSSSSRHQQSVTGSSLSDLRHPCLPHHGPRHDDDDDDDLLLSDSDDFDDPRPSAAAGVASSTDGELEGLERRCRSPDIDVDDDADELIDPATSPTISVGVSSRSSSPDLSRRDPAGTVDCDTAGGPPSSTSASAGPELQAQPPQPHPSRGPHLPTLGLGLGMTASALAGLYHQQLHHPTRPHHLGPGLIPPGLPFPTAPAGFGPFQPSLYPFSPLLSFSVTSPGPNR